MKILVVEDEKFIAKPIEQILKKNNYSVDLAFDGEEGLNSGLTNLYDVIILDIMLPKMDGLEILGNLRSSGIKTPVLMLTARGQIEDKIMGLDSGADDYLAKPFDNNELLARLRALLRRRGNGELNQTNTFKVANIELNPHTLTLTSENGTVKLTLKEAQLLELLIQRDKMVTSKDLIIEKLWELDSDADYSHVEYHVSILRKKLKQLKSEALINTVRGVGYILKLD